MTMPYCESVPVVYSYPEVRRTGCLLRTKHRDDAYCPPCNLRLYRAGTPVRGAEISREEWDRTYVTDADRIEGDTRLSCTYTYDEMVPLYRGVPRHYSGRDGCARCAQFIEGTLALEAEREERNRRANEAFMSRKDISG